MAAWARAEADKSRRYELMICRNVFAVLVVLCAVGLPPALAQPSPSTPDLQSAGALGEAVFAQSGATGMVLVVVRDGQVFFRGYGETAPGSHQAPTRGSVLRLCSLTKIFTTDVLAKLVADGTVQLDDPLQRYAPRGVVVPKRGRPITLENLATHTSGLAREIGTPPRGTPHFTYPDYTTRWRWLAKQRLRQPPGTTAVYSNIGFDLLSDALGRAAHRQYAAVLAERTLNPLGLRNTTFFPTELQCSRLMQAAWPEGPCTSTEQTAGSSGLYSTPADMAVWLQYLLGAGRPGMPAQNPEAQAVYIDPASLKGQIGLNHAGEPSGIGLGWMHLLTAADPSHLVEKTGGGAGFTTYIALNHARRSAIFIAMTWGPIDTHYNLFDGANNLLAAISGLPPMPPPPPRLVRHVRARRRSALHAGRIARRR